MEDASERISGLATGLLLFSKMAQSGYLGEDARISEIKGTDQEWKKKMSQYGNT